MIKERREAYVEVVEILKHMDKKYVAKIPIDLREFFERNASKEYEFHIDLSVPLEQQELKEITISILAMLNINYWCETEEHRQELLRKYHQNEIKYQEELRKKYNTDNLFKKERKVISSHRQENTDVFPQQYKETKWYHRIYNVMQRFIERIFNKGLE